MKKISCLVLAAVLLFTLSCCSKDGSETPTDAKEGYYVAYVDENGNTVTEFIETTTHPGTTDPNTVITVTVPYEFVSTLPEKYQNDLALFCSDNNFLSYEKNESTNALVLTMTATAHNAFLSSKGFALISSLSNFMESKDYPYFLSIEGYNKNFSEITILVDKESYEKDSLSSMLLFSISELCMHSYQIFTVADIYSCTVTVKDAGTLEVIEEKTYNSGYTV